jgi:hypothetical protein
VSTTSNDHADIEEVHLDNMKALAGLLRETFPKYGFALLVFDFNSPGRMNYISNAQRGDMLFALKELITKFESQTHGQATQPIH